MYTFKQVARNTYTFGHTSNIRFLFSSTCSRLSFTQILATFAIPSGHNLNGSKIPYLHNIKTLVNHLESLCCILISRIHFTFIKFFKYSIMLFHYQWVRHQQSIFLLSHPCRLAFSKTFLRLCRSYNFWGGPYNLTLSSYQRAEVRSTCSTFGNYTSLENLKSIWTVNFFGCHLLVGSYFVKWIFKCFVGPKSVLYSVRCSRNNRYIL